MKYWIVIRCNPTGRARKCGMYNKLYRTYDNFADAHAECERLAAVNHGGHFGVFKCESVLPQIIDMQDG